MPIWDYIHFGRPSSSADDDDADADRQYRNLQEGLMQIASQTCNILVQVNNTNNISYGNGATNVQYNNFSPHHVAFAGGGGGGGGAASSAAASSSMRGGRAAAAADEADAELRDVLIPMASSAARTGAAGASPTALGLRGSTKNLLSHYRHRLSVSWAVSFARVISAIGSRTREYQQVCECWQSFVRISNGFESIYVSRKVHRFVWVNATHVSILIFARIAADIACNLLGSSFVFFFSSKQPRILYHPQHPSCFN